MDTTFTTTSTSEKSSNHQTPPLSPSSHLSSSICQQQQSLLRQSSMAGTPSFMAPEIVKKQGYNSSVDWWALGVTIYESSVGDRLFQGGTRDAIYSNIVMMNFDLSKLKEINDDIYDLCTKLLHHDATCRLGVEDINHLKRHPYFKGINWDTVSTEDLKFRPPPHQAQQKSEAAQRNDRRDFYGKEDPNGSSNRIEVVTEGSKAESSIKGRYRRKMRKKRAKKSTGWSSYNSLSILVIDERSDEVLYEESLVKDHHDMKEHHRV